ncbi:MAG TPA: hypothetical protein VJQ78_09020 [Sphingobium sp.]|nr:hypothetical protein [Sphingobium sp.]
MAAFLFATENIVFVSAILLMLRAIFLALFEAITPDHKGPSPS